MPPPRFLTLDEILELHAEQVRRYGGSPGVRDRGLLDSAIAMPSQSFGGQYVHPDLAAMAAAYLFHLVRNHPFVDGNKRIGAIAADVFLLVNGSELTLTPDELVDTVLDVATGKLNKDGLADRIRSHIRPAPPTPP
jgi:death-on-curing protein